MTTAMCTIINQGLTNNHESACSSYKHIQSCSLPYLP